MVLKQTAGMHLVSVRVGWQQESEEGNRSEKGAKTATKTHPKNCQEGAKRFEPRPKKVKIPMRKDEGEDASLMLTFKAMLCGEGVLRIGLSEPYSCPRD